MISVYLIKSTGIFIHVVHSLDQAQRLADDKHVLGFRVIEKSGRTKRKKLYA